MRMVLVWPCLKPTTTTTRSRSATPSPLGLVSIGFPPSWTGLNGRKAGEPGSLEWSCDEDSISLIQVRQANAKCIILLGNEHSGLPPEVCPYMDQVVEIPMMGVGSSLNVAVAGSLVLYKLAGLS